MLTKKIINSFQQDINIYIYTDVLTTNQIQHKNMSYGPLKNIKVLELAGLAPAPMAGMILSDFGANVIRIDRAVNGYAQGAGPDDLARGKKSIALNLKSTEGQNALKKLVSVSDVIIEPFRPGVMERLGLGPEVLMKLNPKLIYARMTGYGQGGVPIWGDRAGHDANYLALSGMLSMLRQNNNNMDHLGDASRPFGPLNLLGDFAGGGLMCALGILLAVIDRHSSGVGQIVDAAMVDGAAYLGTSLFKSVNAGKLGYNNERIGGNGFNQGAHWYNTYKTKDDKYVAVCAVEPQFYKAFIEGIGLNLNELPRQMDRSQWQNMKKMCQDIFITKTRSEWEIQFDGVDACVTPVLDVMEAQNFPHSVERRTFLPSLKDPNTLEPTPAPHLSKSHNDFQLKPSPKPGQHTREVLEQYMDKKEVDEMFTSGFASDKLRERKKKVKKVSKL